MNKIFKKIWNRHRGCFVAVSEAMTAACQKAGKTAAIVSVAALISLPGSVSALTVSGVNVKSESQPANGIWYISLDANIKLDKGAAQTVHLGSKTEPLLTLGGKTTSSVNIQTTEFQRYYNYFVLGHGSTFDSSHQG